MAPSVRHTALLTVIEKSLGVDILKEYIKNESACTTPYT